MSATIRLDLEKFNPQSQDGWHHNDLVSAYLYPEATTEDFEDIVRMKGHAELSYESEMETAYFVTGSMVPEFIDTVNEVDACIPEPPDGFEHADMTITFLW